MHRALQVPEILHMILEAMPPSSLTCFARTARLFHIPAVSYIWKELEDDEILKLTDIFFHPFPDEISPVDIEERWQRFDMYASLVQEFTLQFDDIDEETRLNVRSTLRTLASVHPGNGACLLPRLRSFTIFAVLREDMEIAIPFVGPLLTELWMGWEDHSDDFRQLKWRIPVTSLLSKVRSKADRLTDFAMFGVHHMSPFYSEVLQNFLSQSNITTFQGEFIALSPGLLDVLAHLPGLSALRLGHVDAPFTSPVPLATFSESISADSFVALRVLAVEGSLEVATALLRCLHSSIVELEVLYTSKEIVSKTLQELSQSVQAMAGSITHVSITLAETSRRRESAMSLDLLTPLFWCRSITHFTFEYKAKSALDLRDSHLQSMAHAWPHLQSLSITWAPRAEKADRTSGGLVEEQALSLAGLEPLATHCPVLKILDFTNFDARTKIPIPSRNTSSACRVSLNVGHSRIAKPDPVALYLDMLWPNLKILLHRVGEDEDEEDTEDEDEDEYDEHVAAWTLVQRALDIVRCYRLMTAHPKRLCEPSYASLEDVMDSMT